MEKPALSSRTLLDSTSVRNGELGGRLTQAHVITKRARSLVGARACIWNSGGLPPSCGVNDATQHVSNAGIMLRGMEKDGQEAGEEPSSTGQPYFLATRIRTPL